MRTQEEALEIAKKEYIKKSAKIRNDLYEIEQEILITKNIPEFMETKVEGLLAVCTLPIGINSCPFCLIAEYQKLKVEDLGYDCKNCWYSTMKGECGHVGSIYSDLIEIEENLKHQIGKYWCEEDSNRWYRDAEVKKEQEEAKKLPNYRVGDVISIQSTTNIHDRYNNNNIIIVHVGYNTIQLFKSEYMYYSHYQIKVNNIFKITPAELNKALLTKSKITLVKKADEVTK